jgi:hypothetical protein
MSSDNQQRTTSEKIVLFRSFFSGLPNVYGTYDPNTGRSRQEKKPVTDETILSHLQGKRPFGVYLLTGDCTRAVVADFDHHDPSQPIKFVKTANHYRLSAYIETSKSKGYHVWIFFELAGVKALKARLVVKSILDQIEAPQTEIFPKQNFINERISFGNFIYAPLFGRLVPEGKTVFINPDSLEPYQNQWDFLDTIQRVQESLLDEIIEMNELSASQMQSDGASVPEGDETVNRFALPLCVQAMLQNGVTHNQRVCCFSLAVQLRRIGLPYDACVSVLKTWSLKNRPGEKKRIITDNEIMEQASSAYRNYYNACGCETPEMGQFCSPDCHIIKRKER